jgi:hypothetical protein
MVNDCADAKSIFLRVHSTDNFGAEVVAEVRKLKVQSQSHFATIFGTYGAFPVHVGKDSKKTEIIAFDDLSGGETYQIISWRLDAKISQLQDVYWRRAKDFDKLVSGISLHKQACWFFV